MIAALRELDEDAMVEVLTEPRNALVKQFRKLLEFENAALRFTPGALRAIAKQALDQKIGARGLRTVIEELMLDTMYDLPSLTGVKEIVVDENVVRREESPLLVYEKAS